MAKTNLLLTFFYWFGGSWIQFDKWRSDHNIKNEVDFSCNRIFMLYFLLDPEIECWIELDENGSEQPQHKAIQNARRQQGVGE